MVSKEKEDYLGIGLALGLGVGVLTGVASAVWYQKHKKIDADTVLENVKKAFLDEGPIEGSWIEFEKKPIQKFAIKSKIYTGGITRLEDELLVAYEFTADAYTGTVLDLYRL